MSQELVKKSVKEFWDNEPCGTNRPTSPEGSLAYFEEIEDYRYRVESCIHSFAQFSRWRGKKILEVGCGTGTDLLQFARAGAEANAIDLSIHSVSLAKKRFELYGVNGNILEGDAEHLPFPDDTFDLVYSWGVIHHTPDTPAAVREIYRVLKPCGDIRIMIYNRRSWIGLKMYLRWGLLTGKIFSPLSKLFAEHLESPGTKAYTAREAGNLFSQFSTLKVQPVLTYYDFYKAKGIFPPSWLVRLLGDSRGWFLTISGMKPGNDHGDIIRK
jgi:ubiquinone/menaquinone biosynthesis C-methylase UbiE